MEETKKRGRRTKSPVTFRKLIKGAFGFNGKEYKGSTFELSAEEAEHPKIKRAIECGIIEVKA